MNEIAKLLLDVEAVLCTLYEAIYRDYSGIAPASGSGALNGTIGDRLLSRETHEMLQDAASSTADPIEARSLANVRAFLIKEALEQSSAAERSDVARASCLRRLEGPESEMLSLREAQALLPTIEPRALRDQLDRRIAAHVGAIARPLQRGFERLVETSNRLRLDDYSNLLPSLLGFDLPPLVDAARALLDSTEDAYRDVSAWYLERVCGVAPREARFHDWLYLLRAPWLRREYQPFDLVPKGQSCLREMSIDWPKAIHLDLEERPNKVARAFCVPLSVPDSIALSIFPRGGFEDYAAFYHELGHALHFSHVSPNLPIGVRALGDDALFEGYAMLFEGLVAEPLWVRRFLGYRVSADDERFFALRRLFQLRRSCGKLIYEVELYREGLRADRADRYREILGRALGIEVHREFFLLDVDPHLYCSAYIRAWALEDALRRFLCERWDEQWWRDPATGAFLRSLFARGQTFDAEELAAELGAELSLARVGEGLVERLGPS
ncbi:MAG: hypothetical protein KC609_25205 [Myxococcales bacterium]|nr:hypothetical protein [Myxococcales bacterium]